MKLVHLDGRGSTRRVAVLCVTTDVDGERPRRSRYVFTVLHVPSVTPHEQARCKAAS